MMLILLVICEIVYTENISFHHLYKISPSIKNYMTDDQKATLRLEALVLILWVDELKRVNLKIAFNLAENVLLSVLCIEDGTPSCSIIRTNANVQAFPKRIEQWQHLNAPAKYAG